MGAMEGSAIPDAPPAAVARMTLSRFTELSLARNECRSATPAARVPAAGWGPTPPAVDGLVGPLPALRLGRKPVAAEDAGAPKRDLDDAVGFMNDPPLSARGASARFSLSCASASAMVPPSAASEKFPLA
jgi:hypothetical protein